MGDGNKGEGGLNIDWGELQGEGEEGIENNKIPLCEHFKGLQ